MAKPSVRVPCGALLLLLLLGWRAAAARDPAIWFEPPDSVAQHNRDFPRLFQDPQRWAQAARQIRVFTVTANYLVRAPEAETGALSTALRNNGMKLNVSIPALPVDKHVCGERVEGTIWPGEAEQYARRLRARGIVPDFLTFDLPLTSGYFFAGETACRLSVVETARRVASTVRAFRAVFPQVRFVDTEVPTGKPMAEWLSVLDQWLDAYRQATGEPLHGLIMDIWWEHPWHDVSAQTVRVLHAHGVQAGVFLDADGHPGMTAVDWGRDARRNACALRQLSLPVDVVVVANWMVMSVDNLPESRPDTLTAYVDWYGSGAGCS